MRRSPRPAQASTAASSPSPYVATLGSPLRLRTASSAPCRMYMPFGAREPPADLSEGRHRRHPASRRRAGRCWAARIQVRWGRRHNIAVPGRLFFIGAIGTTVAPTCGSCTFRVVLGFAVGAASPSCLPGGDGAEASAVPSWPRSYDRHRSVSFSMNAIINSPSRTTEEIAASPTTPAGTSPQAPTSSR